MLSIGILFIGMIISAVIVVIPYYALMKRVKSGAISWLMASSAYIAVSIIYPYIKMIIEFKVGWHLYENYPIFYVSSWDVGLAFSVYLAMIATYTLFFIASIVSVRLFFINKPNKNRQHDAAKDAAPLL